MAKPEAAGRLPDGLNLDAPLLEALLANSAIEGWRSGVPRLDAVFFGEMDFEQPDPFAPRHEREAFIAAFAETHQIRQLTRKELSAAILILPKLEYEIRRARPWSRLLTLRSRVDTLVEAVHATHGSVALLPDHAAALLALLPETLMVDHDLALIDAVLASDPDRRHGPLRQALDDFAALDFRQAKSGEIAQGLIDRVERFRGRDPSAHPMAQEIAAAVEHFQALWRSIEAEAHPVLVTVLREPYLDFSQKRKLFSDLTALERGGLQTDIYRLARQFDADPVAHRFPRWGLPGAPFEPGQALASLSNLLRLLHDGAFARLPLAFTTEDALELVRIMVEAPGKRVVERQDRHILDQWFHMYPSQNAAGALADALPKGDRAAALMLARVAPELDVLSRLCGEVEARSVLEEQTAADLTDAVADYQRMRASFDALVNFMLSDAAGSKAAEGGLARATLQALDIAPEHLGPHANGLGGFIHALQRAHLQCVAELHRAAAQALFLDLDCTPAINAIPDDFAARWRVINLCSRACIEDARTDRELLDRARREIRLKPTPSEIAKADPLRDLRPYLALGRKARTALLDFEAPFDPLPSGAKPKAAWLAATRKRLKKSLAPTLAQRIALFAPRVPDGRLDTKVYDQTCDRLRGVIWAASMLPADAVARPLADLTMRCFVTAPGRGILAEKIGNAALWSLEALPDGGGVPMLARILARTKYPKVRKKIDAALNRAAEKAGVPRAELDELTATDHGFDAEGRLRLDFEHGAAEFTFQRPAKLDVVWRNADGVAVKAPPKALLDAEPETRKTVRALVKEIETDLITQTRRIEGQYLAPRALPFADWRERYLDHGTIGPIARRLIWRANDGGRSAAFLPRGEALEDAYGEPVDPTGTAEVSLWHPLEASADEVQAWRTRLFGLELAQPFKQAWRETYRLTDAERTTRTYSNRFAAHILRQHQMMTLARLNGWKTAHRMWVDAPNDEPTEREIPDFGLAAQYWTEGAGGDDEPPVADSGAYLYLASDRVLFRRLSDGPLGDASRAVPLEDVPPRVFSEIMRHCDLFVGVASISADPNWLDRGANAAHPTQWSAAADDYFTRQLTADLTASARSRRDMLEMFLPKLKALREKATLEERHLRVQGVRRAYLIHLGSGAVIREPDMRHVCIVPTAKGPGAVALPFEGDATFSVILSKALLLLADDRIKDPVILQQI